MPCQFGVLFSIEIQFFLNGQIPETGKKISTVGLVVVLTFSQEDNQNMLFGIDFVQNLSLGG